MDAYRKSREFSEKDLVNYILSKWWLYLCVFLVSTALGVVWQHVEMNNMIVLSDVEKEEIDNYILEQEKFEVSNLYEEESIYMDINPNSEMSSTIFLHIRDMENSNEMLIDLMRELESGEFVQNAADILGIESKYLDEVVYYEIISLDGNNEYACKIVIIGSSEEQVRNFKDVMIKVLEEKIFSKYNEDIYTVDEYNREVVDKDLLLYQNSYYEVKNVKEAQLTKLKSNFNENQLIILNDLQAEKRNYNIGNIVKIDLTIVILTCLVVIIHFILSDCIYTRKDVETNFGLKSFSIKGSEKERNDAVKQLVECIQHHNVTQVSCLNYGRTDWKEAIILSENLKECSIRVEFLNSIELDYKETDEHINYIACVKKGKTKFNTLYSLVKYCEKMNSQILGVVIF